MACALPAVHRERHAILLNAIHDFLAWTCSIELPLISREETNPHLLILLSLSVVFQSLRFVACSPGERPTILCELESGVTLASHLKKYDDVPQGRNPWPAPRLQVFRWMTGKSPELFFSFLVRVAMDDW